jgi:hypothetical protein
VILALSYTPNVPLKLELFIVNLFGLAKLALYSELLPVDLIFEFVITVFAGENSLNPTPAPDTFKLL